MYPFPNTGIIYIFRRAGKEKVHESPSPAQRDFQDWQGFRHGFMIRTKHVCAPPPPQKKKKKKKK